MVMQPVAMETPAHACTDSVYQALSPPLEGPGYEARHGYIYTYICIWIRAFPIEAQFPKLIFCMDSYFDDTRAYMKVARSFGGSYAPSSRELLFTAW